MKIDTQNKTYTILDRYCDGADDYGYLTFDWEPIEGCEDLTPEQAGQKITEILKSGKFDEIKIYNHYNN
jgi:hypothetical protein